MRFAPILIQPLAVTGPDGCGPDRKRVTKLKRLPKLRSVCDEMSLDSAFAAAACRPAVASAQKIDMHKVDEAFGRKAATVADDVLRYGFPRSDLHASPSAALALGGWVAFEPMHNGAMMMGEITRSLPAARANPR